MTKHTRHTHTHTESEFFFPASAIRLLTTPRHARGATLEVLRLPRVCLFLSKTPRIYTSRQTIRNKFANPTPTRHIRPHTHIHLRVSPLRDM